MIRSALPIAVLLLAACGGNAPERVATYDGISDGETVYFTGTEPFWGGQASGGQLTYTTPENIEGVTFPVERFTGNSGIGLSGTMDGATFDLTITEGECSDAMSDRTYPFNATLQLGEEMRIGCAWTDARPFTGPQNP